MKRNALYAEPLGLPFGHFRAALGARRSATPINRRGAAVWPCQASFRPRPRRQPANALLGRPVRWPSTPSPPVDASIPARPVVCTLHAVFCLLHAARDAAPWQSARLSSEAPRHGHTGGSCVSCMAMLHQCHVPCLGHQHRTCSSHTCIFFFAIYHTYAGARPQLISKPFMPPPRSSAIVTMYRGSPPA